MKISAEILDPVKIVITFLLDLIFLAAAKLAPATPSNFKPWSWKAVLISCLASDSVTRMTFAIRSF